MVFVCVVAGGCLMFPGWDLYVLGKPLEADAGNPEQIGGCLYPGACHHGVEHAPGGFGVVLGVVVPEGVADMRGEHPEAVAWEFGPDPSRRAEGAEVIKLGGRKLEMVECSPEFPHVKGGVVRDDDLGALKPTHDFRGDFRELGSLAHVAPVDPVAFHEIFPEPAVAFWGMHQPVARFEKFARIKESQAHRADTDIGVIGGFEINTDNFHREVLAEWKLMGGV